MRTLPKRFTEPDTAAPPPRQPRHRGRSRQPRRCRLPSPMGEDWPGRDLLDSPMLARVLLAAWGGDAAGRPLYPEASGVPTTGSHSPVAACRPFQRPGPITQVFVPSSRARNN